MDTMQPAEVGPVERPLERRHPERAAFEKWLETEQMLTATWNEQRNCYDEFPAHLAFKAWCEARPKRAAVGLLINLAADCAQRKPLRWLEPLTGVTHIGHRQFGRAYALADEAVRQLACDLRDAADAFSGMDDDVPF